jgi:hypothetical protein
LVIKTERSGIDLKVKGINWSEERESNEEHGYNHVIGVSALGEFVITWKGWKKIRSYDVDESPFGWLGSESTLESAKKLAQREFECKVIECLDIVTDKESWQHLSTEA